MLFKYFDFHISTILLLFALCNRYIFENSIYFLLYFAYMRNVSMSNINIVYTSKGFLDFIQLFIGLLLLRKFGYIASIFIAYILFAIGFLLIFYLITPLTNDNIIYLNIYFNLLCGLYIQLIPSIQTALLKYMKENIHEANKYQLSMIQYSIGFSLCNIFLPILIIKCFEHSSELFFITVFALVTLNTILMIIFLKVNGIKTVNVNIDYKDYIIISKFSRQNIVKLEQLLNSKLISDKVISVLGIDDISEIKSNRMQKTIFQEIYCIVQDKVYCLYIIFRSQMLTIYWFIKTYLVMYILYINKDVTNEFILLTNIIFGIVPLVINLIGICMFNKNFNDYTLKYQLFIHNIILIFFVFITNEYYYYLTILTIIFIILFEINLFLLNIFRFRFIQEEDFQIIGFLVDCIEKIMSLIIPSFLIILFQYVEFRYIWIITIVMQFGISILYIVLLRLTSQNVKQVEIKNGSKTSSI